MGRLSDLERRVRALAPFRVALAALVLFLGSGAVIPARASNTWIAFSSMRDGDQEIYAMRPDGTGLRNLTRDPAHDGLPMWSPTRRQLAFWSNRNGENALYAMKVDGSDVRKLITAPPETYHWAWSPDGKRFAYMLNRDGDRDIYVMGSDGGRERNISNHPAWWEASPAWSPEGERVAFVSNRDGPRRIYGVDADGRNAELLIAPGAVEEDPAWSPDGSRLAFLSRRRDRHRKDVWIADVGGANARNLTLPADGELESDSSRPAWSPDGMQIAYGSGPPGELTIDVLITNVDTPDPTNLTEHPARDSWPVWFDPRGLVVSPLHSRLTTWGWLRHAGVGRR